MKLQSDVATLQAQPLLGLLELDALKLLAFAGEGRILRAGDLLFRRGELSDAGYLVISGSIALSTSDSGGPASEIVGQGGLIGEMALFTQVERPATALAREPSQVLKLTQAIIHRVLAEYPESAARVAAAISQRLTVLAHEMGVVRTALNAIDGR